MSPPLLGQLDALVPSALKASKFSGPPALWSPQTCGPPHMFAVCVDFEDREFKRLSEIDKHLKWIQKLVQVLKVNLFSESKNYGLIMKLFRECYASTMSNKMVSGNPTEQLNRSVCIYSVAKKTDMMTLHN